MKIDLKIVNLTPHVIYEETSKKKFEPCGQIARVVPCYILDKLVEDDLPIYEEEIRVEGLLAPQLGTAFIVTPEVWAAVPERGDLLSLVEPKKEGEIIKCRGFKVH
jgi:hypothetical protein